MYTIMQNIPTEDPPVFAALNLNDIPWVELKSVDGAALMWQQGAMKEQMAAMKEQMAAMVDEQAAMKVQLASVVSCFEEINKAKQLEQTTEYRDAVMNASPKNVNAMNTNPRGAPALPPSAPSAGQLGPQDRGGAPASEDAAHPGAGAREERGSVEHVTPWGAPRNSHRWRGDGGGRAPRDHTRGEDGYYHRDPPQRTHPRPSGQMGRPGPLLDRPSPRRGPHAQSGPTGAKPLQAVPW